MPGLDLLRAIAIVWVMLYHAQNMGLQPEPAAAAQWGWMGVDLFYALSGFLIGGQLLMACQQSPLDFKAFYWRRALRILPAYGVIVLIYFAWPDLREIKQIQPLWQFLTFTENLLIVANGKAFSHVWSLCVEEHFYLVLPPLVWLLLRKPSISKTLWAAGLILLVGMCWRGGFWWSELAPVLTVESGPGNVYQRYMERIYYPTPARLDGLLFGVLAAALMVYRPRLWQNLMRHANVIALVSVAILGGAIWVLQEREAFWPSLLGFPLLSLALVLLVASASSETSILSRARVPGAAFVASLAYSLYLSHKLVFQALRSSDWAPYLLELGWLAMLVFGLAALFAAMLLHFLIERPVLQWRDRAKAKTPNLSGVNYA